VSGSIFKFDRNNHSLSSSSQSGTAITSSTISNGRDVDRQNAALSDNIAAILVFFVTLAAPSGKRDVTVCLSVCLSVSSAYSTVTHHGQHVTWPAYISDRHIVGEPLLSTQLKDDGNG